jgi:5-methylcytosine-specific restriction endonuclease McrA
VKKKSSARSRRRAEKAIAEGREPGKPGPKRKYSDEEFKVIIAERNRHFREASREEIRRKAKETYDRRRSEPVAVAKKRGRRLKYRTPEEYREADRQKTARYVAKNREAVYAKNNTEGRKFRKAWSAKNPDKVRQHVRTRRARVAGASGVHSAEDIKFLFEMQKGKCVVCLKPLKNKMFHVDHHIPLSKGGSNDRSNLRLLHSSCNTNKGARDPAEHALKNGMLCW